MNKALRKGGEGARGALSWVSMLWSGHIDAHVHADGLSSADLDTLAAFGVEQVLICAHDGGIDRRSPSEGAWIAQFERLLGREPERMRRHGLRALFALGVHPAHAPERGLESLLQRLPVYLSHPAVVALGGLGLKRVDARERWILLRQMEMAAELRRAVLVAAPPQAPFSGLRPLVGLVREAGLMPQRVLVENVSMQMVPILRACGFYMALEPSPGRLEASEVVSLVRRHGPERYVLSSHAGEGAADILALAQTASLLHDAGLSREVIRRVARENALRLVGREDSALSLRAG